MIIWSGLGILIPFIAVLGVIAGTFISAAVGHPIVGPGVGLILAALANWGLWKLVYPKKLQILVDPATGRQVINTPNHSLFFIPARVWTWILAVLAIPVLLLGVAGGAAAAKEEAMPGYKEFKAADNLIDSKTQGATHGNTPDAKVAAAGFSSSMKMMVDAMFSGGSKKNLMTAGEFLTYCYENENTIVFLCHVPSLRSYKSDDAKTGLNELAWSIATQTAKKLDPEQKKTLMVGLRGITSYSSVMQGKNGSENPTSPADASDKAVFLPVFAPAPTAPKP